MSKKLAYQSCTIFILCLTIGTLAITHIDTETDDRNKSGEASGSEDGFTTASKSEAAVNVTIAAFQSEKSVNATSDGDSKPSALAETTDENANLTVQRVPSSAALKDQSSGIIKDSESTRTEADDQSIQPVAAEIQGVSNEAKKGLVEDEPILTFSEFQERARHSKTKYLGEKGHDATAHRNGGELNRTAATNGTAVSTKPKAQVRNIKLKNVASAECGAKVLQSSAGATNAHAVLIDSRDDYMIFESASSKWLVVELCELAVLRLIELANFELFASAPRRFRLFGTDRLPYVGSNGNSQSGQSGSFPPSLNPTSWWLLADYEMKDNRKTSQRFLMRKENSESVEKLNDPNVADSVSQSASVDTNRNLSDSSANATDHVNGQEYASGWNIAVKYVAIEIVSYYGRERFCPLTFTRVFGESVLDGELTYDDDDEVVFDEADVAYWFDSAAQSNGESATRKGEQELKGNLASSEKALKTGNGVDSTEIDTRADSQNILSNVRDAVASLVSKVIGSDSPQLQLREQDNDSKSSSINTNSTAGPVVNESSALTTEASVRKGGSNQRRYVSSSAIVLGNIAALCNHIFPNTASYGDLSSNYSLMNSPAGRNANPAFLNANGATSLAIPIDSTSSQSAWLPSASRSRTKGWTISTDWCAQLFIFVPPECATKLNYAARQHGTSWFNELRCENGRQHANYSELQLDDMFTSPRCAHYFRAFAQHVHRASSDSSTSPKRTALRLVGCYCDVLVATNAALKRTVSPSGGAASSVPPIGTHPSDPAKSASAQVSNNSTRDVTGSKSIAASKSPERDEKLVSSSDSLEEPVPSTESIADHASKVVESEVLQTSVLPQKAELEKSNESSASTPVEQGTSSGAMDIASVGELQLGVDELSKNLPMGIDDASIDDFSSDILAENFSDLSQLEAIARQLELPVPIDRLLVSSGDLQSQVSKLPDQIPESAASTQFFSDVTETPATLAASTQPNDRTTNLDPGKKVSPDGDSEQLQQYDETSFDIDTRTYSLGGSNLLASREASFARLIQRVKQLQTNMTISMRYLDELSQRYRRQMDTLHRRIEHLELATGVHQSPTVSDLERRIAALERNSSGAQVARVDAMQDLLNTLENQFETMANNVSNSWSQSTSERTIILILIASQCSSIAAIAFLVYTVKKLGMRLEAVAQDNPLTYRSFSQSFTDQTQNTAADTKLNQHSQNLLDSSTNSDGHRSTPTGQKSQKLRSIFGSVDRFKLFNQDSLSRRPAASFDATPCVREYFDQLGRPHSADRAAVFDAERSHRNEALCDDYDLRRSNSRTFEQRNIRDVTSGNKSKRKRKKLRPEVTDGHDQRAYRLSSSETRSFHQLNAALSLETRQLRSS